jgi:holo-[acyl-carrier protein] synthase
MQNAGCRRAEFQPASFPIRHSALTEIPFPAGCYALTVEIIGTGIDATDIDRIADAIGRHGDRFLKRVFTEGEIAYCQARRDSFPSFAARFAAKEAAMKALGTGHSRGVFWTGIEVFRRGGPPQLRFHAGAADRLAALGANGSLLTLTHSKNLALAHVLILKR